MVFFIGMQIVAKVISYGVGIANSFYWNKTWTFQSRSRSWTELSSFVLVNIMGLAINAVVMLICLKNLSLPELAALGMATSSTLLWNFVISKWFIFQK
jgi:putative flippase GtrA